MKDSKYFGNYLGIVIRNDDIEHRGRIKVFIPHLSVSLYENWAQPDDDSNLAHKSFRFPGKNIASDLTEPILDVLRKELPWAECALPLVGENASGRYNAFSETASISDTNKPSTFTPTDNTNTSETLLNQDNIGESPGRKYELQKAKLYDAFTGTLSGSFDQPNRSNLFGYNYTPNTYSNKSKGSFSIPSVGAHVWCFFVEGDQAHPVYFAVSQGAEDWHGIYECHEDNPSTDYPGTFENKSNKVDDTYDINTETYRNKFVINQKAGSLEFVNTDNKEILKMTHYSGSFKEFNNVANIELAVQNDQKMVLEDQFLTVNGYGNYYVGRDSDNLIKGDQYIKIGKLDQSLYNNWREEARKLANIKQLFETQRATNFHADHDSAAASGDRQGVMYRRISSMQTQNGTFASCPVCQGTGWDGNSWETDFQDYYYTINNRFNKLRLSQTTLAAGGTYNESTSAVETGNSSLTTNTASTTDFIDVDVTSLSAAWGRPANGYGNIFGKPCNVCGGLGHSPSSMNGNWTADPKKSYSGDGRGEFEKKVKEVTAKLKDIEKQMGRGGSQIINVAKHKIESIGLAMNDFPSVRVDPYGKIYRDSVIVHPLGVFNSQAPSPLTEYVHVDDLPGGTYTQNIGNRWNVQVGAGGISIKSYGPVDIGGTIVNMAGEQVNVTSQGEVNIDGGKRLTLVADILSIRQRNRKQVLVDSNLGVSQNVIIGGGLHVEGELSCNHITAPVEIQETELTRVFGKLLKGTSFNCQLHGGFHQDVSNSSDNHPHWTGAILTLDTDSRKDGDSQGVQCYDHSHHFKNVPLHLKKTNEGVRKVAERCNSEKRSYAAPIEEKPSRNKVTD
jgi:hypothetical protein